MTTLLGIPFGIVFLEAAMLLKPHREVLAIRDGSKRALTTLASGASDQAKEAEMRRESVRMFAATGLLTLKFAAIGAALAVCYWLVVTLFPGQAIGLKASFASLSGITMLTGATVAYAWIRHAALARL